MLKLLILLSLAALPQADAAPRAHGKPAAQSKPPAAPMQNIKPSENPLGASIELKRKHGKSLFIWITPGLAQKLLGRPVLAAKDFLALWDKEQELRTLHKMGVLREATDRAMARQLNETSQKAWLLSLDSPQSGSSRPIQVLHGWSAVSRIFIPGWSAPWDSAAQRSFASQSCRAKVARYRAAGGVSQICMEYLEGGETTGAYPDDITHLYDVTAPVIFKKAKNGDSTPQIGSCPSAAECANQFNSGLATRSQRKIYRDGATLSATAKPSKKPQYVYPPLRFGNAKVALCVGAVRFPDGSTNDAECISLGPHCPPAADCARSACVGMDHASALPKD
jgi:hypothetical protein